LKSFQWRLLNDVNSPWISTCYPCDIHRASGNFCFFATFDAHWRKWWSHQWSRAECPWADHISHLFLLQTETGPFPKPSLIQLFAGKIKTIRRALSSERQFLQLTKIISLRSFCYRGYLHRPTVVPGTGLWLRVGWAGWWLHQNHLWSLWNTNLACESKGCTVKTIV
jgi:hypothetical protein